jgi:hypothetical protein
VHKFKNSPTFLPISHEEKVRKVLFETGGRLNIHCGTTMEEPYFFIISVDYKKALFYLPHFLQSMENLRYESLMKEIEVQVDRKM